MDKTVKELKSIRNPDIEDKIKTVFFPCQNRKK